MKEKISSIKTKKYTRNGGTMIIMDLKINNFFAFQNFHINMSYPKKIVNSYIEGEFLEERENFRYKKVNILMGANATGKTSIGQMLMTIFNFIKRKEYTTLKEKVCNKQKMASFSMDFVLNQKKLYRIDVILFPEDSDENDEIKVSVRAVDINKRDNYEMCAKKIDQLPIYMESDFVSELEQIERMGWLFSYPSDSVNGVVKCPKNPQFSQILDYTLRALDPSIEKVEKLKKVENAYVIRMESQDLIIQDGEVIKNNILSSGTKAGIDVADMLSSIYARECGFYYCDEKFSYIHSEIEKAFLSIMINGLHENDQIFFTTHNMDILDMPLPKHSFTFLQKDIYDKERPIKCVNAGDFLKRNTDSIRNAVDNDLFSVAPNVDLIYRIEELKN